MCAHSLTVWRLCGPAPAYQHARRRRAARLAGFKPCCCIVLRAPHRSAPMLAAAVETTRVGGPLTAVGDAKARRSGRVGSGGMAPGRSAARRCARQRPADGQPSGRQRAEGCRCTAAASEQPLRRVCTDLAGCALTHANGRQCAASAKLDEMISDLAIEKADALTFTQVRQIVPLQPFKCRQPASSAHGRVRRGSVVRTSCGTVRLACCMVVVRWARLTAAAPYLECPRSRSARVAVPSPRRRTAVPFRTNLRRSLPPSGGGGGAARAVCARRFCCCVCASGSGPQWAFTCPGR